MKLWMLASSGIDSNSYLIYDDEKTACAVVDPSGDFYAMQDALSELGLLSKVVTVLLTHGHFDHIELADVVRDRFNVPAAVHKLDAPMLGDAKLNLSELFGMPHVVRPAERMLTGGDEIMIGKEALQVLHTPGHTPGGVSFYAPGFVASGDTLFEGGVGRADFPGGDMTQLLSGIRSRLLTLDDETVVWPGHGGPTVIGREKQCNPYLGGGDAWSY